MNLNWLLVFLPISLITCYIGLFPSLAMIMMAQSHLYNQLYTNYLALGGEPIPLKPWEGPAPMMGPPVPM